MLLFGETGVGKELCAELVHNLSPRRALPFVRVNCAALSELSIESELFGYERGAFAGAVAAKPGLLESASSKRASFPLCPKLRSICSKRILGLEMCGSCAI